MPEGFLKLVHLEEAVGELIDALSGRETPIEEVNVADALGRVVARDLESPEDLPGFERSSMDGFAVRASDTFGAGEGQPVYLELVGEVPMGAPGTTKAEPGQALRISTGGVLPEGADAVVMVENTELSSSTVEVVKGVARGENIIRSDDDIAKGSLLLQKGQVIGPPHIGALAGLGITKIAVFALPDVGVISTGDELVSPDEKPGPGQVRDVNSAALASAVEQAGGISKVYGIIEDDYERLLEVSHRALSKCGALIISGGSSAGVRDVTVDVIRELGKPGLIAHGIYLKPGKPTLVAVCEGKPVLGFPGNPASALAVFREVFLPVLRRLRGEVPEISSPVRVVEAVLGSSVASATGRLELVPVTLSEREGELVATPVPGKSNLIGTLARAGGQVRIPEGSEGLEKGDRVIVELLE
ncbi:MAG: molybdopterin molybdenumtransferase MoeA [Actinobacteria bacterium]|nr:molybdopterin molybdenumtransferase MoeA [Actinomycetota bacterium]